jgi:hypothetical protein
MSDQRGQSEIEAIARLPENERAAAIMHFIYIQTIARPDVDWETRLAPTWAGLDERAKEFNRAVLETWKDYPDLIGMWLSAVKPTDPSRSPTEDAEPERELA